MTCFLAGDRIIYGSLLLQGGYFYTSRLIYIIIIIFAPYDTGTIKRFERPFAGFEEVSLTLRTDSRK